MDIHSNSILGEVVAYDFHTASVFSKHKIDFCCNGKRSLAEAYHNAEDITQQLVSNWKRAFKKRKARSRILMHGH